MAERDGGYVRGGRSAWVGVLLVLGVAEIVEGDCYRAGDTGEDGFEGGEGDDDKGGACVDDGAAFDGGAGGDAVDGYGGEVYEPVGGFLGDGDRGEGAGVGGGVAAAQGEGAEVAGAVKGAANEEGEFGDGDDLLGQHVFKEGGCVVGGGEGHAEDAVEDCIRAQFGRSHADNGLLGDVEASHADGVCIWDAFDPTPTVIECDADARRGS